MPGTPVIFNVAYTPYKLKKGSTEEEIKAHAEKRAYYDFTGDTNYLRYMTTEGKLTGTAVAGVLLEELQDDGPLTPDNRPRQNVIKN